MAILALGFITGIIFYRKRHRKMLPVIILLMYAFVSQIGSVIGAVYFRNNIPNEHLSIFMFTMIWAWFFYLNIDEAPARRAIRWLAPALAVFFICNTLFLQDLNTLPSNSMKLATLFNLVLGSYLFIRLLDLPGKQNVFQNPIFLVAVGLVWFHTISSFHFFLTGFMFKYKIYSSFVGYVHLFSNYVYYLIIFMAMFSLKKYNQNDGTVRQ